MRRTRTRQPGAARVIDQDPGTDTARSNTHPPLCLQRQKVSRYPLLVMWLCCRAGPWKTGERGRRAGSTVKRGEGTLVPDSVGEAEVVKRIEVRLLHHSYQIHLHVHEMLGVVRLVAKLTVCMAVFLRRSLLHKPHSGAWSMYLADRTVGMLICPRQIDSVRKYDCVVITGPPSCLLPM
jgi:hypothetical protein